jgi:hypothetical protein
MVVSCQLLPLEPSLRPRPHELGCRLRCRAFTVAPSTRWHSIIRSGMCWHGTVARAIIRPWSPSMSRSNLHPFDGRCAGTASQIAVRGRSRERSAVHRRSGRGKARGERTYYRGSGSRVSISLSLWCALVRSLVRSYVHRAAHLTCARQPACTGRTARCAAPRQRPDQRRVRGQREGRSTLGKSSPECGAL